VGSVPSLREVSFAHRFDVSAINSFLNSREPIGEVMKIAHRKGLQKRKRREREATRQKMIKLGLLKSPGRAKTPAK
jgi:hypothetical protein